MISKTTLNFVARTFLLLIPTASFELNFGLDDPKEATFEWVDSKGAVHRFASSKVLASSVKVGCQDAMLDGVGFDEVYFEEVWFEEVWFKEVWFEEVSFEEVWF